MTLTAREAAAFVIAAHQKIGVHDLTVTVIPDANIPQGGIASNYLEIMKVVLSHARTWTEKNNKITYIKRLRESIAGLGLSEAKNLVEAFIPIEG